MTMVLKSQKLLIKLALVCISHHNLVFFFLLNNFYRFSNRFIFNFESFYLYIYFENSHVYVYGVRGSCRCWNIIVRHIEEEEHDAHAELQMQCNLYVFVFLFKPGQIWEFSKLPFCSLPVFLYFTYKSQHQPWLNFYSAHLFVTWSIK